MEVRRKVRTEAEAVSCLRAAASSGEGRAAWARSRRIDARSLNAWRLNLERRDGGTLPPGELRLVEVVAAGPWRGGCTVVAGPWRVEVDVDFDEGTLRRVLSALSSC